MQFAECSVAVHFSHCAQVEMIAGASAGFLYFVCISVALNRLSGILGSLLPKCGVGKKEWHMHFISGLEVAVCSLMLYRVAVKWSV